jgi:hypothetical protein
MTTLLMQPLGKKDRFLLGAALAGVVGVLLFVGLAIPVVGLY